MILVLKLQCFVIMQQHADTLQDFTQNHTKQKFNALTKTCFIDLVNNCIYVGFTAS